MSNGEIKLEALDQKTFVKNKVSEIASTVKDEIAINALSGGVDSSVVTMLAHRALNKKLKTYFINHGLMRVGEPEHVVSVFQELGVPVNLLDARDEFFTALKGKTDPA